MWPVVLVALFMSANGAVDPTPDDCLIVVLPDADLRRWLSSPDKAFQVALQNDLPDCIQKTATRPYGVLTDIMTSCTDPLEYPGLFDPWVEATKGDKISSTQSHPNCGCSNDCKQSLASIQPECWQKMFEVFCAYEVRSVTTGASLEAVYNQLMSRKCYTQAPSSAPLTCDDLQAREDPRSDIRINDVANGSSGLSAALWACFAVSLIAILVIL